MDAHLDLLNQDLAYNDPRSPRPEASNRVFDYALDLSQPPSTTDNRNSAVVNAFYWCNWMHDRLYDLGFTEAAGNFQWDNFERGGVGGDPVLVDVQDGGNVNFAQMHVAPEDGQSLTNVVGTRLELHLFNGPVPDRDPALDAEVILHEYTHGLSERRVGQGVGLSHLQSMGLSEGWSDFYALALLAQAADAGNGNYAWSAYSGYYFTMVDYGPEEPETNVLDKN